MTTSLPEGYVEAEPVKIGLELDGSLRVDYAPEHSVFSWGAWRALVDAATYVSEFGSGFTVVAFGTPGLGEGRVAYKTWRPDLFRGHEVHLWRLA